MVVLLKHSQLITWIVLEHLTNPKFILLDECDMFRKSEQEEVRHVTERYIGKSNPYLVMVSTPNAPGGLFEKIEKESEETCIYQDVYH